MKTTTLKSFLVTLTLFLILAPTFAQDLIGTRIDVMGTNYGDQMWLFAVPTCTRGFDQGWDATKMFGSPVTPQLFAMEPQAYYQIDCIPDLNNTYLGFIAGIDTAYTFTFTHENLTVKYTQLFLIDSIANKTVDIYQTGTTYSFTAHKTDSVRRFKIVTSLPQVIIVPTAPKDTVVTTVIVPTVVTPTIVTPPVVTPPVVTPPVVIAPVVIAPVVTPPPTTKKDQPKKLKIYNSGKTIYIENPGKKGKIKLVHAITGKTLKTSDFNASGTTIIYADVPTGTYVVNGVTDTDNESIIIIIR